MIALADGNRDCRDMIPAQVSMKGGEPEINIRCSQIIFANKCTLY
jgi:hypothetical protein